MPTLASKTNGRGVIVRGPNVPEYTKEITEALRQVAASLERSQTRTKRGSRDRSGRE